MDSIVVVGTGYVGLPAALMWAKAGHSVVGVDIDQNVVRAINEGTMLINEVELQNLLCDAQVRRNLVARETPCEGDVFVIAVPTPVDRLRRTCDLGAVRAAVSAVAPHLRRGNLVLLESTVPPMTCERVLKPLIEELSGLSVPADVMLAHCPERILPGDIFREIVHNERLVGGMDERSSRAAAKIYSSFVEGALHITDALTAELSKLMENTYRDVNIALANEFSQICELLGADARAVRAFANRHPRVNILEAGIGVGGHCIPVDPWFLKEVAPESSSLITAARRVNDGMPARVAAKIRKAVSATADPQVVALGATYKKNCEDLRESPALEVVRLLQEDGYAVSHYDPLVKGMEYASIESIARGVDLIAILVGHDLILHELANARSAILGTMRMPRILAFAD